MSGGNDWTRRQLGGVPAHVTVLYPFVPPNHIGADLLADLEALFPSAASFPFHLRTVNWFGDRVVWLAPEPGPRFRQLTNLVAARWPDFPPYGGSYADPVPHLTIGENAPPEEMELAAHLIANELPISGIAREVWLMTGSDSPDSWTQQAAFRLGRLQD